jgi:hypothetical protein
MITSGEGRYRVWVEKHQVGSDLLFVLGGGECPHVGGAVICEPGKAPLVLSRQGHFDVVVLEIVAVAACQKYRTTVVAVGGIHIDDASKDEINVLVQNCRSLVPRL